MGILVVDDDLGFRNAVGVYLELEGYHVMTAGDGLEALQILKTRMKPKIIILDLVMPVIDGWSFLKLLRSHESYTQARVLVVSTVIDEEICKIADGCLRKPFELESLLHLIQEHWSKTITHFQ